MAKRQSKGRGWFGDSAGHSKAGRKGGRARARNQRERRQREKGGTDNIHTALMDQEDF